MEKKVMINIKSAHFQPSEEYFAGAAVDVFSADNLDSVDVQRIDIDYEGVLKADKNRVELVYGESELTGMEGATTSIAFERDNPGLVTMSRAGTVSAMLCFEAGERIISSQAAENMEITLVIETYELENSLGDEGGELKIRYGIEFRGSLVERVLMHVVVR